jgi:hypothetical protein
MPTKLYLRNITNSQTGTFPSGEQSSSTATQTATGANTLRSMIREISAVAQSTLAVASGANLSQQLHFMGFFCSPPLKNAFSFSTSGTITLNAASIKGNNSANWCVNALSVYVWRPGTGSLVGYLRDAAGVSNGAAINPGTTQAVDHNANLPITSAVSAQINDVIICEVWAYVAGQSASMSYNNSFCYSGTTENTTEDAASSNHASFLEFSDDLAFTTDEEPVKPRSFAIIV